MTARKPTVGDWRTALVMRKAKNGKPVPRTAVANAITILGCDERWSGVLASDAFLDAPVTTKPPPWGEHDAPAKPMCGEWTEEDSTRATSWLSREYDLDLRPIVVEQAVSVVSRRREVHPVRDWLGSLSWDGTARIDRVFAAYFSADDTAYVRGVGARFMIGAVARVYSPGAKVDCTPVLEGAQGIGKSTGVRLLAGDAWFFDSPITMGDKDGFQTLRGKWIGELGELHSLTRSEVNRAKAFLSATQDTYRPSFARRSRTFPRQCVFIGTTNATEYLRDETGNRRFWPVRCAGPVDVAALARDREQLWAEARVRFERGEAWHVDSADFARLCEAEQEARMVEDEWAAPVREWLSDPKAPERRRDGVTAGEVLAGALGVPKERWSKAEQDRVATTLRRLGWERPRNATREGSERVRRWKPRAAVLVTAGDAAGDAAGDGPHMGESRGIKNMTPGSPASAHIQARAPAGAHSETGSDTGVSGAGDHESFSGYLEANGIEGAHER